MLGRRELVKGAAGMFGLGKPTPSRFPYASRPQPLPGVAPSSGQVSRVRLVIVSGPSGAIEGVFIYQPGTVPALGNPPIYSATAGTSDPFGNPAKPQSTAYGTDGTFVQMLAGAPASLFIGSGDSAEATAARLLTQVSGAGVTRKIVTTLRAPRVSGEGVNAACSILLFSESADLTIPALLSMVVTDDAGVNTSSYNQTPTGFLFSNQPVTSTGGTPANPTLITTDTYHTIALLNSWAAAGAPNRAPVVQLQPNGKLWCGGTLSSAAATAATWGSTAGLGSAYIPATRQSGFAAGATGNVAANRAPYVQLDTAGNLTLTGANALPAAGVFVFSGEFDLT
jgi:hypothetical protein